MSDVWPLARVEAFALWLRAAGRMDAEDVQHLGECIAFLASTVQEHGCYYDDLVEARVYVQDRKDPRP